MCCHGSYALHCNRLVLTWHKHKLKRMLRCCAAGWYTAVLCCVLEHLLMEPSAHSTGCLAWCKERWYNECYSYNQLKMIESDHQDSLQRQDGCP